MSKEKRQLSAILFADITGYTAMMQEDEIRTGRLLSKFQETLKEQTAECNGQIVNFYGDGCLVVFQSPIDAVRCAGSLQVIFQKSPKVPVRIGLHAGDVIFKEDNVYGDSVNLTSRIESIGVPGSVLFSESIKNAIENHSQFKIAPLGKFSFKNVKKPTTVYALANAGFVVPKKGAITGKLNTLNKGAVQKVLENAKSALAILGIIALLFIGNFSTIKSFIQDTFLSSSLKEKKVAVMFFDNETGDEQLGGVGKMAADWITQQLMDIEQTQVVLPSNVRNNIHLATASASLEGMQDFAKATGAEVVINGRYYQSGDQLIVQAQVVNVQTGEIVHALNKPITGKKSDPLPLIQEVSQRITGFWAVQDRQQFNESPPKLGAYQAYLEGRKFWGLDYESVEEYFLTAYRIDSTFVVPLVELVASKIDQSDYYQADSLLNFVLTKSDFLSKVHQLQIKAYEAQLHGQLNESVRFWEKIYAIDQQEFITITNLSRQYLNTNQPAKALTVLEDYDIAYLDFQECVPCQEYYELLTYAHFQKENYQKVIDLVDNFDFDLREGLVANYYLKSLVHVGAYDNAYEKMGFYLGENLSFNGGRQSAGLLLVGMLFEMEKLNKSDVKQTIANLLVNYGEHNDFDWLSNYYLGVGLYAKEDYTAAAEHFEAFYQGFKEIPMIIDLGLGSLAACHIQLKNYDKLEEIYQFLSRYNHPYAASFVTYTKAKMEAQLGHKDKANALLAQSIEEGQEFLWFKYQNDPLLLPLYGDDGFEQLVAIQ
ncbi:MAG: adenylate/guanylate cyclase domain-containing protein [Bacteroidota bacterium]